MLSIASACLRLLKISSHNSVSVVHLDAAIAQLVSIHTWDRKASVGDLYINYRTHKLTATALSTGKTTLQSYLIDLGQDHRRQGDTHDRVQGSNIDLANGTVVPTCSSTINAGAIRDNDVKQSCSLRTQLKCSSWYSSHPSQRNLTRTTHNNQHIMVARKSWV